MRDFGGDHSLEPTGAIVVVSRDRNWYVPVAMPVESNVTFAAVIPVLKSTNPGAPGFLIWTSYLNPAGAVIVAILIANLVPASPDVGLILSATVTVPIMPRLWWKLQWYVNVP